MTVQRIPGGNGGSAGSGSGSGSGDDIADEKQQRYRRRYWKHLLLSNAATALVAVGLTYSLAYVRFTALGTAAGMALLSEQDSATASYSSSPHHSDSKPSSSSAQAWRDEELAKPLPLPSTATQGRHVRLGSDKKPAAARRTGGPGSVRTPGIPPSDVAAASSPSSSSLDSTNDDAVPEVDSSPAFDATAEEVEDEDEEEDDFADDDFGLAEEYEENAELEPANDTGDNTDTTATDSESNRPGVLVDFGQGRDEAQVTEKWDDVELELELEAEADEDEDEDEGEDPEDDQDEDDTSDNTLNEAATAVSAYDRRNFTRTHNLYRVKHGVPRLAWSTALAQSAQAYASRCVWGHSGKAGVGENLYATSRIEPTSNQGAVATVAVQTWYNEIQQYNYAAPGFSPATGHATQVLWKSSMYLGCGIAVCPGLFSGWTMSYVVCQYSPPGNYIGQFAQNVLPPVSPVA